MTDNNAYYQPGFFDGSPASTDKPKPETAPDVSTRASGEPRKNTESTKTMFTLKKGDKSIRLSYIDTIETEEFYTRTTHTLLRKTIDRWSDQPSPEDI